MGNRLVREVGIYISKRPQLTMGGDYTLGTDYLKTVFEPAAFILPKINYRNDAGRPGNSHEFATKQCAEFIRHPAITISDEVNSTYAGRLALRNVGGAVVDTQQGGTAAWKHKAVMLDALITRQLPLTSVISILGGADYRFADFVCDRFRMEQTRNDVPRYSSDLIGSGRFLTPNGIDVKQVETATATGTVTGAGFGKATVTAAGMPGSPRVVRFAVSSSDPPATWAISARAALAADVVTGAFFTISGTSTAIALTAVKAAANDATMNVALDNDTSTGITATPTSANTTTGAQTLPTTALTLPCFDGNLTEFFWTDQNGLQQLTGSGCTIMSMAMENGNNTRLNDRCAGDPTITVTDGALTTTPSHVRKMKHMARGPVAQVTILMDDTIPDWFTYMTNDQLTDVTFRANGPIIASSFRHSLAMIMPKARVSDLSETEVEGEAALQLTIEPFFDTTSNSALTIEVVNTDTSNYD